MVFQVQVWYEDKCISLVRVLILHFFLYSCTCMYYHSSFYFLFFWNSCIIHISCCLFWSFMYISFSLHRNFYPIFAFLHHGYGRRLHFLSSHSDIPLTPPPKNYITPLSINKYWINYRKRQTTLKLPAPPLLPPLPQPLTTPQQLPLPLPPLHLLPPH